MENVLHDGGEDEEDTQLELTDEEIEDLLTTKFVTTPVEKEECEAEIESIRAAGSPMELCLSPIRHESDDCILEEHPCLLRVNEQPQYQLDGANQLLNRILSATEDDLKKSEKWNCFEKSKKWKNSSRVSELNLINAIIPIVDHRPTHLHIYCRRLIETDFPEIICKSLLEVDPPTKRPTLFRMTQKSEMPLTQFLNLLDAMISSNASIKLEDTWVTALKKNLDGSNQKFRTNLIGNFAALEHRLAHPSIQPMIASVHFVFKCVEKPFITVNAGYHNELDSHGRRCKMIVIEHLVSPPGTTSSPRVTFGTPLVEVIHEFDIEDNVPFIPLKYPFKIQDLNKFLSVDPYQNVTFR